MKRNWGFRIRELRSLEKGSEDRGADGQGVAWDLLSSECVWGGICETVEDLKRSSASCGLRGRFGGFCQARGVDEAGERRVRWRGFSGKS